MKKKHILLILVVLLTLSMSTAAFAKKGGETVEGVFIEFTTNADTGFCETLVIETDDEELVTFTLPDGYDCINFDGFESGITYVKVSGEWNLNDEGQVILELTSITQTEPDEGDDDGEGNGSGSGGVYCNGDEESGRIHPVAQKIASKYEGIVDPAWVQEMACDGFGFGEVMLAIQTQLAYQKMNGTEELSGEGCGSEEPTGDVAEGGEGEPDGEETVCNSLGNAAKEWLNQRKAGLGWGEIWHGKGLVKNDKTDNPPPGWLKKQAQEEKEKGPKEGKGPNKGEDHPSNNSNRPEKENKNNKNKDDEGD